MVPKSTRPKLVTIVGPTASGKSDLAMRVAQEFDGEIIAADSRTVYKGMDIGTAKPSEADQINVKHWGLDLVKPGQRFTAYQFKKYAQAAIADIQKRGKLPILVGGTGLYIDSILFDFGFLAGFDPAKSRELQERSIDQLQQIIEEKGYPMPENFKNKRYLINTIGREGKIGTKRSKPAEGLLLVGLLPPDEILKQRINRRAEQIFAKGVVVETKNLLDKYGEDALLKTAGIVYKICLDVLVGQANYPEAIERFKKEDWQYARRQKTWFKRNKFIHWFVSAKQAYEFLRSDLA